MAYLLQSVQSAVALLRGGDLVAVPTETVYGLAAVASQPAAVARVFATKGRPADHPLIVHVSGVNQADHWVQHWDLRAEKLARQFWPGPLTLVLPARDSVSRQITAGQDTVALRQPRHPLLAALLADLGEALVAPSANRFMAVSPTCASHVLQQFPEETSLGVLDGGACEVGLESTIVSVLPGSAVTVLRPGGITRDLLETTLGETVQVASVALSPIRVPGQHTRHYAPRTPVLCCESEQLPDPECCADPDNAFLVFGHTLITAGALLDLGAEPSRAAQRLYAALYDLDALGANHIILVMPPKTPQWAAIRDRVQRAGRAPGALAPFKDC